MGTHKKRDWRRGVLRDLWDLQTRGEITRRDLIKTSALLGLSGAAALAQTRDEPVQRLLVSAAHATTPQMGGSLRCASRVRPLETTAAAEWTDQFDILSAAFETLTRLNSDGSVVPLLAERWIPSDDFRTWTFGLREGVRWSNGDYFTADHVIANFDYWLSGEEPPQAGRFSSMFEWSDGERRLASDAWEKIDDHTFQLHLRRPDLFIAEHLAHPTTSILFPSDLHSGSWITEWATTGPFRVAEHSVGEISKLQRRYEDYWGTKPYLDEIQFVDFGDDPSVPAGALASGQVHLVPRLSHDGTRHYEHIPGVLLHRYSTGRTCVARMRVSSPPFDNLYLRQAISAGVDNGAIARKIFGDDSAVGENHHVGPMHPDYVPSTTMRQRDTQLARELLGKAGENPGLVIEIEFPHGGTGSWHERALSIMKEQLAEVGILLSLKPLRSSSYWDVWNTTPFGFTEWRHRPRGLQTLNLAYRSGVPWNETQYCSAEFDRALDGAGSVLDPRLRCQYMARAEQILQRDAVIVQPVWVPEYIAATHDVHGLELHPTGILDLRQVWLEE